MRPGHVVLLAVAAAACEPATLPAVGAPGGPYRPNEGCATAEGGGGLCPLDPDLAFDSPVGPSLDVVTPETLTDARITCVRTHCGTGAFAVRARYRWDETQSPSPRLGTLEHRFATPVDLLNKTISFRVYVDNFVTPMNAQIAVVYKGVWRVVDDGALLSTRGWNTKGGLVSPTNPFLRLNETPTSMPVTEIKIQVYLATRIMRGADPWVGDIYIDDVAWH